MVCLGDATAIRTDWTQPDAGIARVPDSLHPDGPSTSRTLPSQARSRPFLCIPSPQKSKCRCSTHIEPVQS